MPSLRESARGRAPDEWKLCRICRGTGPASRLPLQDHSRSHGGSEPQPAFRVFRLSGSNEVYAYEEKFSGTKVICKFYGPKFGWDRDKAAWVAHQEYEGLKRLRRYNLVGSPIM